ncbi:MAG TPA: hypothetical protein VLV83_14730 [Acidobacteriota bacterium]|nr:hypothetical protein [Acidobacteriota bacterium]
MKFPLTWRFIGLAGLAVGAVLRLMGLIGPQLWLDEIIQIQRFNHPAWSQALADLRTETAPAPLDYLVQLLFLSLAGLNEAGARLHAALAAIVALLVFCKLAEEMVRLIPSREGAAPEAAGQKGEGRDSHRPAEGVEERARPASWQRFLPATAVFLLGFYPLHIFYSGEGRPYSLFFLLTLTSFWLLLRALRLQTTRSQPTREPAPQSRRAGGDGQPRQPLSSGQEELPNQDNSPSRQTADGRGKTDLFPFVLYGLALTSALYTSFQGLVLAALQMAWVGWLWLSRSSPDATGQRGGRPRQDSLSEAAEQEGARSETRLSSAGRLAVRQSGLLPALISQAVALLLFTPWIWWSYSQTQDEYVETFLSLDFLSRLIQESSGGSWPLSLLLLSLAGWGFTRLYRLRARGALWLLVIWLGAGLAMVLLLDAWRGYFFAARQILFLAPAGLLAAALGWSLSPRLRRSWLLLLLAASLGTGTVFLSDRKQQADWIALAELMRQEVRGGDRIAAPGLDRVLAFRYPQLPQRQIALDDLLERPPENARVLLVRSRYLDASQERQVTEILQRIPTRQQFQLPGFHLYILEP